MKLMEAKNYQKITKWVTSLNEYSQYSHDGDFEKYKIYHDAAIDALYEMHNVFKAYAKSKDTWAPEMVTANIYGLDLIFKSIKTNIEYRFGFDDEGLYMSTYLVNWKNLGLMKDDFWVILNQLKEYGTVQPIMSYYSKEQRKEHPELFRNNTSLTYSLVRDFFWAQLIEDKFEGPELKIQWSKEKYYLDMVLDLGSKAFKNLHRINYLLWKQ